MICVSEWIDTDTGVHGHINPSQFCTNYFAYAGVIELPSKQEIFVTEAAHKYLEL